MPLLPGHPVGIHWPNDVYAAGRKLAGVLVEVLPGRYFVVGIGLNVNNSVLNAPDDLRDSAAALMDLSGAAHDRMALLVGILRRFCELLADWLDPRIAWPGLRTSYASSTGGRWPFIATIAWCAVSAPGLPPTAHSCSTRPTAASGSRAGSFGQGQNDP